MAQRYENSAANLYKLPENHPVVSIIYLLLLMVAGAAVLVIGGVLAGLALYGLDPLTALSGGNYDTAGAVGFLKIIQFSLSLGMFIIPPLLLARIERQRSVYFRFSASSPPSLWLWTVVMMLAASRLIELSAAWNQQMTFPPFLQGLENWMKAKEAEATAMTHLLLSTTSYGGLAFNLLLIAVIASVGEEFTFRGVLQPIFKRWTGNGHAAVWITALIFSAIHLQFYGFLPRMLMGVIFGYLYLWSKNIWLPVLAHFINNAGVVIYAFILQQQGESLEKLAIPDNVPWYVYLFSLVIAVYLLVRFHRWYRSQETPQPL